MIVLREQNFTVVVYTVTGLLTCQCSLYRFASAASAAASAGSGAAGFDGVLCGYLPCYTW